MADLLPAAAFPPDAHAKALTINLNASIYGTFAEIGAGQEVARWFMTVGAASGSVAQTISAYDKTVSDDCYGAGTRYVSKERLLAMLEHEYQLLVDRLGSTQGAKRRFFVFADTAASRNFKGDNEQHAWVGLRFQTEPGEPPSNILLHVNLMDRTATLQQQALGLFGVNLIYAAFHLRATSAAFLECLWDDLTLDRLEVDVLELEGPAFAGVDARLWCLQMLRHKMAHVLVFDTTGKIAEPSGILRKRPIIVDRGRFNTIQPFHAAMLKASEKQLRQEGIPLGRDPIAALELTLHHAEGKQTPDDAELLKRIDQLVKLGSVLVTDFAESYLLEPYLRRHTAEPVRFAVGVALLARILCEEFYEELPGRMLEGIGKLFTSNIKVYAFPMPRDAVHKDVTFSDRLTIAPTATELITADDLLFAKPIEHLYRYLREAGWIVPITVE